MIEALGLRPGGIYIDCTLGEGGHTLRILESTDLPIKLLGLDTDSHAVEAAKKNLSGYLNQVTLLNKSYTNLLNESKKIGFNQVQGIIFDLGLSSMQLQGTNRGFSFRTDSPLDMRFNDSQQLTAWHIVNLCTEMELREILKELGEEPYAKRIARSIVKSRPVETTVQLARIIVQAAGRRKGRVHPATRSFQAIRMKVNDELNNIEKGLDQASNMLSKGGRLVVISYHSLEDRIVKRFILNASKDCICDPRVLECSCEHKAYLKNVYKKVVKPNKREIELNPRSRSARLRVAERIET